MIKVGDKYTTEKRHTDGTPNMTGEMEVIEVLEESDPLKLFNKTDETFVLVRETTKYVAFGRVPEEIKTNNYKISLPSDGSDYTDDISVWTKE